MKQLKFTILFLFLSSIIYAQEDQKISSMAFVQIQNDNVAEAMHYYENNWKVVRLQAQEKNYIDSYQLLKAEYSDKVPFHLILVTTFKDKTQFAAREKYFQRLIENVGELNLLNHKIPNNFRKILFETHTVHLN